MRKSYVQQSRRERLNDDDRGIHRGPAFKIGIRSFSEWHNLISRSYLLRFQISFRLTFYITLLMFLCVDFFGNHTWN